MKKKNIQEEVNKILHQYGHTEMGLYKIQLLFEEQVNEKLPEKDINGSEMMKNRFGNKRCKANAHISSIFSLLPAIQFYMERESFEDAIVFMLSFKLFNLEFLIGIKTNQR